MRSFTYAAFFVAASCALFPSVDNLGSGSDAATNDGSSVDASIGDAALGDAPIGDSAIADGDAKIPGAIALRNVSSKSSGQTTTSIDINKPAGTQTGDFVWVLLAIDDDTVTVTVPSSWQMSSQLADSNLGFRTIAYGFFASASEPASYSLPLSMSIDWSIILVAYSGVRSPMPYDVSPTFTKLPAPPPYTAPSITTTTPNALALWGFTGESGDGTWSLGGSSPLTSHAKEPFLLAADEIIVTPGATGVQSASYSSSTSTGMVMVGALAPQ